jgi:twitching motility protein PilT
MKSFDFSFEIDGLARFRVNLPSTNRRAVRTIPTKNPDAGAAEQSRRFWRPAPGPRGMVLVTGPTGSGKSTTPAAMVNYPNENEPHPDVEDPIEFVNPKCLINQRGRPAQYPELCRRAEVRAARRPDAILVGDAYLETIRLAMHTAAERDFIWVSSQ